jgi:hypothetical protein
MSHRRSLGNILRLVRKAERIVERMAAREGLTKDDMPPAEWEKAVLDELEKMKR